MVRSGGLLTDCEARLRLPSQFVDTVLPKLFARGDKMTDLYALLDECDAVILPEVEPIFRATGPFPFSACMFAILLPLTTSTLDFNCRTADPSRASAQILIFQTRYQMCLRCSSADGPIKRGQKATDEATTLQLIRAVNPKPEYGFLNTFGENENGEATVIV